jgi:hypothetical protein
MSAYLDKTGRPQLRESITAFLDVLGFSHAVLSAAEAGQSEKCLESIVRAMDDARDSVRSSLSGHDLADPQQWSIKFFSDNLLVGYPIDEVHDASDVTSFVLRCSQRYQLQMALSGFFVRGAVARGPLCVTDDIVFGTALIESFLLEASASIVPRIIVTEPSPANRHLRVPFAGACPRSRC